MTLCILHLGAEKTGTSSIQKYFGVHREALLGEGLLYPESFTNPSGHVHLKLSGAAVDGSLDPSNPQGVAFRAELDRALKRGAKTVVFSSEFFHSELRDNNAVERLKAFLSAYFDRFKLIYYARRQDQMLASMHSTAIQGGWTTDPRALSVYESKGHYYFDHAAVCDLWAGAFGRENLVCRIFERDKLINRDIIDDVISVAGANLDPERPKVSANESLSFETMHVLLLLNGSRHKDNRELRRRLIATGKKRDGERVPMLTRSEAEQFLARFDETNRRFFSQYVDASLATAFSTDFGGFPQTVPEPPPPRRVMDFVFSRKR
jgi:hypothetical protein